MPRRRVNHQVVAFDKNDVDRPRNNSRARARDLNVAIENRHGDAVFFIVAKPT